MTKRLLLLLVAGLCASAFTLVSAKGLANPVSAAAGGQRATASPVTSWTAPLPVGTPIQPPAQLSQQPGNPQPLVTFVSESFDGTTFPPTGWTQDNPSYPWLRQTSTRYPSGYAPHSGAGMAEYNIYSYYTGTTCRLITPSFGLSAQAPTVNFWYFKSSNTDYGDYFTVQYRVNSGSWTQLGGSYNPYNGSNTWLQVALTLPSLTGSVQVAFFGYSNYGYSNIYVDDVVVATLSANDVGCTSIPSPVGDTGTYTPTATIHNYGTASQASFGARYYATGPGATYDNTITGLHLAAGADTTVSFPSWHITVRGSWALSCSTRLTGDQQTSNDKYATTRGINPPPPTTNVLKNVTGLAMQGPTGFGGYTMGYYFSPQVNGQITAIGRYRGPYVGDASTVKLWRVSDQALLASATVSDSGWGAVAITPVSVTAGTRYCISTFGGTNVYYPNMPTVPYVSNQDTILYGIYTSGDAFPVNQMGATIYGAADVWFSVVTYTQDVGCIGIPSPSGDTGTYVPSATIHNGGTNAAASFGARFYASGPGATYDQTITGLHLRPGADTTVVFPSWHITVRGSWAMKCSTQLPGDQVQSNDKYAETRGINNSIKVLMAGTEGDIAALRALIVSNSGGLISAVDYFAAGSSRLLPHALYASGYRAILTYGGNYFSGSGAIFGDSLAVFEDLGGGALNMTYSTCAGGDWCIGGRYMTQYTAVPATSYGGVSGQTMSVLVPSHPIMSGVSTVGNGTCEPYGTTVRSATYGVKIANWTSSGYVQCAAFDSAGRRSAFLGWYPTNYASLTGQWLQQLINALVWVPYSPPAAADVGCTAIPAPAATIPVNVAVTPQGTIHNFGTTAQGPFNCSLWTVGSTYHSTVRQASVPPDVTLNFDAWTPTVGGVYTLKCSTKLASDANPANNASTKSILVYDALETFEASAGGYTASGGWARGTPSGGSRPTSHSGSNVWGDVLTGMYLPNASDPLYSPTLAAFVNNPTVAFYQYYYLESGYDGGYMSYSTNNGSTWTQITNPTPAYNGYPSCFGGTINAYMGGPLSGWQAVSMTIPVSAGANFKVRWLMGSEGSVQYEGWLIDDVMYVGCFPLPAVTVTAPNGGELWPVNSVQTITWTNAGGVADRDSVWYSTNTGSSWTLITVNIPGTTSYAWTLPIIPSSANCLVKVKSSNAGGSNADSSNAVFTILNVPAPPTLLTPPDAVLIADATPDFTWSGPGDYYQLQVDDDPLFGSPAIDVQQPGTSYTPGSDIADGRWYWHVRSSNDGGLFYSSYSAPFYFDLDATLPLAPALYLPADNSYPAILTPTFNWGVVSFQNPGKGLGSEADASPVTYRIEVATDSTFPGPSIIYTATSTDTFVTSTALPQTRLFWHVRGEDGAGNIGPFSGYWAFEIDLTAPAAPLLYTPANNAYITASAPSFWWGRVSFDAQGKVGNAKKALDASPVTYRIEVATDSTFPGPSIRFTGTPTDTHITSTSLPQGRLFWHVRGEDANGNIGLYCAYWAFTIDIVPPAAPILRLPANHFLVLSPTPQFVWSKVNLGADALISYRIQVSTESLFAAPIINTTLAETTYTPVAPLGFVKHFWRVMAKDTAGNNGAYSARWDFTVLSPSQSWSAATPLPPGPKAKNIKDGAALAYGKEGTDANDTGYVYAFKGNNRYEFYRYNTLNNVWVSRESIPALNRNTKKKGVKKGSTLVMATDGKIYAAKGNNTLDWWQYNPVARTWIQKADVPVGAKNLKEGVGSAAVKIGSDNYVYLLRGSGTYDFYRYNTATDVWDITLPTAPGGVSTKPYKNGSSLTYDGNDTIYCLKGSYNEFAAYSISGKTWVTKDPLPLAAPPSTKKKKVKDGSGTAYAGKTVYALKGGNTDEFWTYKCDSHRWVLATQLPAGSKRVKGGGALVAAKDANALFAFRGNNTAEFWTFGPVFFSAFSLPKGSQGAMTAGLQSVSSYKLLVSPNPFTRVANVSYAVPKSGNVSLKLYDVTGTLVTTLADGYTLAGNHNALVNAEKLARGIYLLKFDSDGYKTSSKLIIE